MQRFDFDEDAYCDLSARIHVIGACTVTLIYNRGDEEFPPAAQLVFDRALQAVDSTEELAELPGQICTLLCRTPCDACCRCGFCDWWRSR